MNILELTTTVETEQQAKRLAHELVASRLAACVQISGPIQSVYRWKGEICETTEFRCTCKSTPTLADKLCRFMANCHPYDTPEILLAERTASAQYADWLAHQVNQPEHDSQQK